MGASPVPGGESRVNNAGKSFALVRPQDAGFLRRLKVHVIMLGHARTTFFKQVGNPAKKPNLLTGLQPILRSQSDDRRDNSRFFCPHGWEPTSQNSERATAGLADGAARVRAR